MKLDVEYIAPPPKQPARKQLGAGFIITPGQLSSDLDVVNRLVDGIGVDVNEQKAKLPKAVVKGWEQFWNEWKGFYARNQGLGPRLWGGLSDQIQQYKVRTDAWQQKLTKAGLKVTPDRLPTTSKPVLLYVGIAVAGIVGLFIVGKLLHKVMLSGGSFNQQDLLQAEREAVRAAERRRLGPKSRSV